MYSSLTYAEIIKNNIIVLNIMKHLLIFFILFYFNFSFLVILGYFVQEFGGNFSGSNFFLKM